MKILIMLSSLLISNLGFSALVDGEVFYKVSSGELSARDMRIEVPSRGKGEVVLFGDGLEWRSKIFKTIRVAGQSIFIVAFKVDYRSKKSTFVFKGSYINATNQIRYYGDIFKITGHSFDLNNLAGLNFVGGFNFNYQR